MEDDEERGAFGARGASRVERDQRDPLVARAIAHVTANIAALSASEIVQLALFPDTLADWAAGTKRSGSLVFNCLRRLRPYGQVRLALADRLGVPVSVLSHLIDAEPAHATSELPAEHGSLLELAGVRSPVVREPIAWDQPPYPLYREGTNPLERLAVARLRLEAPAMPTSRLVGLLLFPESIASWARRQGIPINRVLSVIGGTRRVAWIETALARRLDITPAALTRFIGTVKREARATRPVLPEEQRTASEA